MIILLCSSRTLWRLGSHCFLYVLQKIQVHKIINYIFVFPCVPGLPEHKTKIWSETSSKIIAAGSAVRLLEACRAQGHICVATGHVLATGKVLLKRYSDVPGTYQKNMLFELWTLWALKCLQNHCFPYTFQPLYRRLSRGVCELQRFLKRRLTKPCVLQAFLTTTKNGTTFLYSYVEDRWRSV